MTSPAPTIPPGATLPLLLDAQAAANLLGIGRTTLWKWHSNGMLGPQRIRRGGVVRWRAAELQAWVEAGMPPRERWAETHPG